jgi:hypothetical protein
VGLDDERSLQQQQQKVGTPDEMLASIFDAAARIKKREDQFRRTTPDLRTRVAKRIAVDDGILEHILSTVTHFSFMCNNMWK